MLSCVYILHFGDWSLTDTGQSMVTSLDILESGSTKLEQSMVTCLDTLESGFSKTQKSMSATAHHTFLPLSWSVSQPCWSLGNTSHVDTALGAGLGHRIGFGGAGAGFRLGLGVRPRPGEWLEGREGVAMSSWAFTPLPLRSLLRPRWRPLRLGALVSVTSLS